MQIKPAVRGLDKAARSSIFPRTRAQRSAESYGDPLEAGLSGRRPAPPGSAGAAGRAGRRRAGSAPAARAEARGGHPAPSRGLQGPAGPLTLKKSSWCTTLQLGRARISRRVRVVLPPLVTLRRERGRREAPRGGRVHPPPPLRHREGPG